MEEKLCNSSNSKTEFYIWGDFNIDLLQVRNNRVIKNYADNLVGYCDAGEKVEKLNSWHNFLLAVFTPQTASCGPERWVSSLKKTSSVTAIHR